MSAISAYDALLVVLGLGAGFAAGLFHFATLHRTVAQLTAGSAGRAGFLQLGRFAVMGAVLLGLALLGAGPLLAGFLGVLAARRVVLRRHRGAP